MTLAVLGWLILPVALLSACGSDSSSTATDQPSATTSTSTSATSDPTPTDSASPTPAPDWPACGDVWQAGGKIPFGYKGCLDGATSVPADNLGCSSGQKIVRYADAFYGVAGGLIYHGSSPLDKDQHYLKMVRACRA